MDIGFHGILPKRPVLPTAAPGAAAPSGLSPLPLFDGEALSVREVPAGDPGRIQEEPPVGMDEDGALERKDSLGQLVASVLDLEPPDMPRFV